ncbi:MAG: hypothetical protein ABI183_17960 [Polyangiaceae bacterium]
MIKGLALATIFVGLLRGPGCGEVDSPEYGANAPCTRNKDCAHDLACVQGVCVSPLPEDDASTDDASIDDAKADAIADAAASDG